MSGKVSLPKIDARKANDLLRQLRRMAPHYTKEWPAKDDDDPGVALLKIFSFIAEGVIGRLNRAPERNFLAFLDMLGIRLLPATPARAPVRFLLAKGTEEAVLVPTGTQVSATELPFETIESLKAVPATLTELFAVDPEKDHIYKPPPKFLELELAASEQPPLTVKAFSAADSKFLQLDPPDQVKKDDFLRIDQVLDPNSRVKDCLPQTGKEQSRAIDHLVVFDAKGPIVTVTDPLPRDYAEGTTVKKVTEFELFEEKNWQEHILYLAHADYFAIKSEAQFELLVELAGAVGNLESLNVVWEFFGATETEKEDGWHRFEVDLDGTLGFSRNGSVVLNKPVGEIKEKEINGNKSRWIRGRLDEPLPAKPIRPLPTIESITFKVSSGAKNLAADQAFANDTPLTIDVPFYPFGTEPRIFDGFSIASEEAFSKPGAEIDLTFELDTAGSFASRAAVLTNETKLRPELSWEYWNGRGWLALIIDIDKDTTARFLRKGQGNIRFKLPEDAAKTEVAGQENFWIRTRLVGGDYGGVITVKGKGINITVDKTPIFPPLVKELTIKYKLTELKPPQICLTFNNLNYLDQSAANIRDDKHFKPYVPLADTGRAVYFGFDQSFEGGPVKLYFAAKELEVDDRDKPKLTWEFGSDNTWKSLIASDGTDAFTKPEYVSLVLPDGFQNSQEFGKALYWLRATLTEGSWPKSPLFQGVFLNTVAALQARTVRNEILGSSTSVKNQKFRFQQVPVIEGEEVRVREALTDQEREQLVKARGAAAVLDIKDQRGEILQTWIRWTEVLEFYDSESNSRDYRLDRATGEIEFGDGVRGRIPPGGGDNIQAFAYQSGGGASGNVGPGEITSAVTAVAGVDSVKNPVAGGGGSEAATNDDMLEIGPAQISNRGRAVTPEDFERLAREASREVRKALCLPNRNAGGRHELGWTSVHIVPDSKSAEPRPSLELRRAVQRFLALRADATLVDQDHIFVGPPKYVPVSVSVTVFAKSLDVVASAELSVKQKLEQFLHPLTGGPANEGWEFGRDLAASDLHALLEGIDDVDHVGPLRMIFEDTESEERVEVDADSLIASGTHAINMSVATENG